PRHGARAPPPRPTCSQPPPPPASARAAPTSTGPPPPGTFAVRGAPGPAHLLPRGSRSPATAPLLPGLPPAPPPAAPPLSREGPSPSASLPAPGAPPVPARSCGTEIRNKTPEHPWEVKKQALRLWNERLGNCQVSSFRFTQAHHRGHKGDFFQREDRVIKSKVHYLLLSFVKRFCFLDLPGTSQSRRLELQRYTLTGIIFGFRERCEELCESRVTVLPENTSVPAGVRSTLDLVQSHSQGPIWVAKTVTEIQNKTP
ncbi:E3 ubiquitin-protein ligase ZNF598-like, partial [Aquila chrysaetos chrysaetos]|uniref:E3 ubiquitin-protein ligase ZNF598-like n=1 Tax=Aquila chrysaetos chrysaetos TaxID=223781 RepID=UPI001B7D36E6